MSEKEPAQDRELVIASKIKRIFANGDGKDILTYLMSETGYTTSNYSDGMSSTDLAFREGRRSVIAEIIQITNVDIKQITDQSITEQGEWDAHRI